MLNRRSLVSALAGTPFAVRSIDAKALMTQGLAAAGTSINAKSILDRASCTVGPSPAPVHPLKQLLGIDPWELRCRLGEEREAKNSYRHTSTCDPDLQAIRSYSPTYRARKQIERNLADQDLYRAWERACERW